MYDVLAGLRIVEGASFMAAPFCTLNLAQLGAEVIRFDTVGGGPDYRRWPLAPNGASLYWEAVNKGKRSVALDLASPEGRELALAIATAPGANAGLFVTNFPLDGFLAHDRLAALRPDLVSLRLMGWHDGRTATDYTVNAASGLPLLTGPEGLPAGQPVNHALPAWDLIAGSYAGMALLAAERRRRLTGEGAEIRLPLGDVAAAVLGHISLLGEVAVAGEARPRLGNQVYGAFGGDFATADGRRLMLVALTRRQWRGLLKALGLEAVVAALEERLGVDFAADEGARFRHRAQLTPLVAAAVAASDLAALEPCFAAEGVCWSLYRSVAEAAGEALASPLFAAVTHPSGQAYPTPGAASSFVGSERRPAAPCPRLGQDTDAVLSEVLGLSEGAIGRLHDRGLVAGPERA